MESSELIHRVLQRLHLFWMNRSFLFSLSLKILFINSTEKHALIVDKVEDFHYIQLFRAEAEMGISLCEAEVMETVGQEALYDSLSTARSSDKSCSPVTVTSHPLSKLSVRADILHDQTSSVFLGRLVRRLHRPCFTGCCISLHFRQFQSHTTANIISFSDIKASNIKTD